MSDRPEPAAGALDAPGPAGGVDVAAAASAPVEVGAATPEHAAAIRAIDGLSASTVRLLDGDLVAHDRCCLVATVGTEVVGFAAGLLQLDDGHVLDLAVDPAARGRGVGRLLLDALLSRLRGLGARAATLEVRPSNAAALTLYDRAGFAVEGRRPRYYPDGEDALLLWRRDLSDLSDLSDLDRS